MSELFEEIKEDIRRERFEKLWNSFGKIMVGISVAIVIGTVAAVVEQDRRQEYAMQQTAQFIKGVDRMSAEDYKGAAEAFDVLTYDPAAPYYALALMRKAQAQAAATDKDGARRSYGALARRDDAFGQLAAMQASAKDNALPVPARNSAFYYTQSEWRGWQLLAGGKKDEAVSAFLALKDDLETPYSIRGRMTETLQYLAPEKLAAKDLKGPAHE